MIDHLQSSAELFLQQSRLSVLRATVGVSAVLALVGTLCSLDS